MRRSERTHQHVSIVFAAVNRVTFVTFPIRERDPSQRPAAAFARFHSVACIGDLRTSKAIFASLREVKKIKQKQKTKKKN